MLDLPVGLSSGSRPAVPRFPRPSREIDDDDEERPGLLSRHPLILECLSDLPMDLSSGSLPATPRFPRPSRDFDDDDEERPGLLSWRPLILECLSDLPVGLPSGPLPTAPRFLCRLSELELELDDGGELGELFSRHLLDLVCCLPLVLPSMVPDLSRADGTEAPFNPTDPWILPLVKPYLGSPRVTFS